MIGPSGVTAAAPVNRTPAWPTGVAHLGGRLLIQIKFLAWPYSRCSAPTACFIRLG